jgi:glycosyltransferase involved in cell wall biosynthesis
MSIMKISVVIPTYRREALLTRCIEALYRQDFDPAHFEIIIVSDGPDPTLKDRIVNLYSGYSSVHFFSLPEKKGPAAARNAGWRNALGELIVFSDDDCIPHPTWLSNYWKAFQSRTQDATAFTGRTIVPISRIPTDYELNISRLATAEFITANCACTREALELTGGFDEAFTMAWREDSDLQFRLMHEHIPIVSVEDAVVTHPVRKAKWCVSLKEEKKGIFNALLYKKFPQLYREKIQPQRPWLYYGNVFFFSLLIGGLTMPTNSLIVMGFSGWSVLTLLFIQKRLQGTSRKWSHVLEMIVSSAAIPFLSLYWRWYGAFKYKTPLL